MKPPNPVRRLLPILILNLTGFAIAIPVLPALAYAVGGSALDVGLLYAIQSLGQFLMAPGWGRLSDRFGRKPILLITFAAAALLELITAFTGSLPFLYLVRFLVGLCAANVATASALIADSTDGPERSKAMAVVGISFALGFTFGPAIGAAVGLLATPGVPGLLGAGMPFAAAAAMNLLTLLLGSLLLVEPTTSAQDRQQSRRRLGARTFLLQIRRRPVLLICLLFFLYTIALTVLEGTFFIYMEAIYGYDIVEVGSIFAVMGLMMVLFYGAVGPISRAIGDRAMTLIGLILLGLGLAIAPLYHPLWFLFTFLGIASFGRVIVHPGILAMMSAQSQGPAENGQLMGILQSAASLGRIIGPAIGGALFTALSPKIPFHFAGIILLITALAWWFFSKKTSS